MKKEKDRYISGTHEYLANTFCQMYTIPNSQTIPTPICTEFGSANLFIFLFAGKITTH